MLYLTGEDCLKKYKVTLKQIQLVGISTVTSNANEMSSDTAKIGKTLETYFHERLNEKIHGRVNPGVTYCVYTNYVNGVTGEYTYFVGEETNSLDNISSGMQSLIISAQYYIKFVVGPGEMPQVCINAWKDIWNMSSADLDGERQFIADFEVYDDRAKNPKHTELDIYIGVRSNRFVLAEH